MHQLSYTLHLLLFCLFCAPLTAQEVTLVNLSPTFGQVTLDHFSMVSATNTTPEDIKGTFVTTLSDIAGETVAELRSYSVTLTAGQHLASLEIPWTRRVTYGANKTSQSFARRGILDFGAFNICTVFIDAAGNRRGITCTERQSVPALSFSLVYPLDNAIIADERPVLSWEEVGRYGIADDQLSYSLLVVEQLPGQSAAEALENNPPMLSRKRLRSNSLLYPVSGKVLRPEKTYAWRVTAHSGQDELIGSQRWTFHLAEDSQPEDKPVAKSYAMLDTRINNREYIFTDAIQLGFDNNEGVHSLDYNITNLNEAGKALKALPTLDNLEPGLNTLDIPTRGLGLKENTLYQLEVNTPRGQRYFLQFRIKS